MDAPSGVLIWTTRPPVGVPLAIEMVTVAWVPSPLTARLVTVIAPSTELFRKNVTPFAPAKPAPVSVRVTLLLPGAALDGATALMNGSTDTATPAAEFVAEDGAGGGPSTRTLAGAAVLVAEDLPAPEARKHRSEVAAVDSHGLTDPSPAKEKFKIRR